MPKCTMCRKIVPLGLAVALRCTGCQKDHCLGCKDKHFNECPEALKALNVKKFDHDQKILNNGTKETKLLQKL